MIETRTFNYCNYRDLQDIVQEKLGVEWSFIEAEEWRVRNDTYLVFDTEYDDITFPANLIAWKDQEAFFEYDTEDFGTYKGGHHIEVPSLPCANEMLSYLVEQGHIPGGKYLVDVSW